MTSHDVINRLRRILSIKQIGHSGTLDPMAEGVMAVGVGKACRLLQYVRDDKVYRAEILLGTTTDTDDIEGKTLTICDSLNHFNEAMIGERLSAFVGKQAQVPPVYSAIKKDGMKMYELARKGEAPDMLKARPVEIYSLEILSCRVPHVSIRVACSKGTYIRALARDLGRALEVGGCLSGLVREQVGPFRIEQSVRLGITKSTGRRKEKDAEVSPVRRTTAADHVSLRQVLEKSLITPSDALALPRMDLPKSVAKRLAHGQTLHQNDLGTSNSDSLYIAYSDDCPVALVSLKQDGLIRPEVVLVNAAEF